MEPHLYSEGIEASIEDEYWLSQKNVESWEGVNEIVDRGNIGSQDVYRKEILEDEQRAVYSVAITFFEQFELEYARIPDARIEEKDENLYLVTAGINMDTSQLDREEAYGFASAMTLLGDIEWGIGSNVGLENKPVLVDIEFIGEYLIPDSEAFRETVLESWFERKNYEFDEVKFNNELKRHAQDLPEPEEVSHILTEETETENDKQQKFRQELILNIEEALTKARKGEFTLEYISKELCDVSS